MERWLSTFIAGAATIAAVAAYACIKKALKKITIFDYQQGILYRDGSFVKVLPAGSYWTWTSRDSITVVDTRRAVLTLAGQEVITADKVGVKLSVLLSYQVTDAEKAVNKSQSWYQEIYAFAQLAVRDELSQLSVEQLMQARSDLGERLLAQVKPKSTEVGVDVLLVEIKDIVLPQELRKIFAEVLRAQKEGLAALERARGEQAALRSLANAARLLEGNQSLMNLRTLQAINQTPAGGTPPTVVLTLPQLLQAPAGTKDNSGSAAPSES